MKIKEIIQELKYNIDTILFFLKVAVLICISVVVGTIVFKTTDIKPLGYTVAVFIMFLWWVYEVFDDVREDAWRNMKKKIQKIITRK